MSTDIRAQNATQSSFTATPEQGIRMPHCRFYWRCRRNRVGASLWFAMTLALMIVCTTYAQARIFLHQTEGVPVQTANITKGREREKRVCRVLGTSSAGPSAWKLGFCQKVIHMSTRKERRLIGPGSHPPSCIAKCGKCVPCKAVHVPIQPGRNRPLEYYPEAWRCKCGNKLYLP